MRHVLLQPTEAQAAREAEAAACREAAASHLSSTPAGFTPVLCNPVIYRLLQTVGTAVTLLLLLLLLLLHDCWQ